MITSFRMYNAVPRAAQAWRALFSRVFADVGLEIELVEHGFPKPIADLWAQPSLCCAFMCGWPFVRAEGMQPIAAPVPSPPKYEGLPRYRSEFLAREESGWKTLEQTFGSRFGWMARDSQSGFHAPNAYLSTFLHAGRPSLYREMRGPLGAPMKTLEALRAREVDVVALDGFFLDLCRYHEPARLEGIRRVAMTPWTPIPLLVAAAGVDPEAVSRLRGHLTQVHEIEGYGPLLADVLLSRFVAPKVEDYRAAYCGEVSNPVM